MSDDAIEEEAYDENQQDIEVVDAEQVIGDIGDEYMQIPEGEVTEEHVQYVSTIPRRGKHEVGDNRLPLEVEEEIIVETDGGPMVLTGGVEEGDLAECVVEEEFVESDCETEEDILRDRAIDEALRDPETGNIGLTMDLDDLVSRTITFDNGEKVILCFNKLCQPQVAWNGHLYELASELSTCSYTRWVCVCRGCPASMRTAPGFKEMRAAGHLHLPECIPNDLKVRRRIIIYDLRLMVEFTDDPLDMLYNHFVSKLAGENPDVLEQFPPYEVLHKSLERHREYKIYRRRFEYGKMLGERKHGSNKGYIQRMPRERPFPPSICIECGASLVTDTDSTSQEAFVEHMKNEHGRETTILYYSFHTVALFEQWMRELQNHTRYKIRRFGMHNECLYFLCGSDDRWCRAAGVDSDGLHCTAFVRVYDYRRLRRHETKVLRIQYCLDHCFHNDEDGVVEVPYSPDVFLQDLEERRKQKVESAKSSGHRSMERTGEGILGSETGEGQEWPTGSSAMEESYQYREVYEPRDARDISLKRREDSLADSGARDNGVETTQVADFDPASGQSGQYEEKNQDFEPIYVESEVTMEDERIGNVTGEKVASLSHDPKTQQYAQEAEGKEIFDERREMVEYVERCNRSVSQPRSSKERYRSCLPPKISQQHRVTQREKFESYALYNLVMQIELQTEQIRDRAQFLKLPSAAKRYLQYLSVLCELMSTDPTCSKNDRELAAEIFGIRDFPPEVLMPGVALPSLPVGSGSAVSSSEQPKPLIFIPVVPGELSKGAQDSEKARTDDAEQVKYFPESEQGEAKNLKREREKDDDEAEDGAPGAKKLREKVSAAAALSKSQPLPRTPYQTRRSRGIVKPNTSGIFDQRTYMSGADTSYSQNAPSSSRTDEARGSSGHAKENEQVIYKRVPFGGENRKVRFGGQMLQYDAKEMSQPFTLKTLSGDLVSVSRRSDGKLFMISPVTAPEHLSLGDSPQVSRNKSAASRGTFATRKTSKQDDEKSVGKEASRTTKRTMPTRSARRDRQDERTIREAAEDAGGLFEKSASEASSDEFQQIDSLRKEATSMSVSRKELTTDQDIAAVDEETFLSTGNESTAQVQNVMEKSGENVQKEGEEGKNDLLSETDSKKERSRK